MRLLFIIALLMSITGLSYAQTDGGGYLLDMVHHNPGEALTKSDFNNPSFLKAEGYNGIVINDFTFAHTAITFDSFDKRIFPVGSKERTWVLNTAEKVRQNIRNAHLAGLKAYYFTDIIVLPKSLVALYQKDICDENGKISFERPKTIEIHRLMFKELFKTFPDLDGLVIRTGETYLNNVPYHTGNNPVTNEVESHVKLLELLKEEVCDSLNKTVFYRTWSFGGMHDNPDYYLKVTNQITPDKNLIFSIKHTQGDYHRTFNFNPTLGIGQHKQIVEVQCQREYEGKGAYPNYIAKGVIDGFEEYQQLYPQKKLACLNDFKSFPQYAGLWTWSRGGGWVGPYISNELWCRLNADILNQWAQHPQKSEESIFYDWTSKNGMDKADAQNFRKLALLSAKAVLRMHESAKYRFDKNWVWWTRDEFLGGTEAGAPLKAILDSLNKTGKTKIAIAEKYEAVKIWEQIVSLSKHIKMNNEKDAHYIRVSSEYGLLLSQIIAEGWQILAWGNAGNYNHQKMQNAIARYDNYWKLYRQLKEEEPSCATLYKPFSFEFVGPLYHGEAGMDASISRFRVNKISK